MGWSNRQLATRFIIFAFDNCHFYNCIRCCLLLLLQRYAQLLGIASMKKLLNEKCLISYKIFPFSVSKDKNRRHSI